MLAIFVALTCLSPQARVNMSGPSILYVTYGTNIRMSGANYCVHSVHLKNDFFCRKLV
jgi:hypothetical protein